MGPSLTDFYSRIALSVQTRSAAEIYPPQYFHQLQLHRENRSSPSNYLKIFSFYSEKKAQLSCLEILVPLINRRAAIMNSLQQQLSIFELTCRCIANLIGCNCFSEFIKFLLFIVSCVEKRLWWPMQSPKKGREKKAKS